MRSLRLAVMLSLLCISPLDAQNAVDNEIIVGLRTDRDSAEAAARIVAKVGTVVQSFPRINAHLVHLHSGVSVMDALVALTQDPAVVFVEPNRIVRSDASPNDPLYLPNQWAPQRIQADLAWEIWQPVASARLAMIDSGIQKSHPDLMNKITRNADGSFFGHSAFAGDFDDDNGHGTNTSGIAAAQTNNSTGIAGIAGWDGNPATSDVERIKILPVKTQRSTGNGSQASLVDGIDWAEHNGATVMNMSVGIDAVAWDPHIFPDWLNHSLGLDDLLGWDAPSLSRAVYNAWRAGITMVASAGNSGSQNHREPASLHGVIAVAASTRGPDSGLDGIKADSNWGDWVDVLAPGSGIRTTRVLSAYDDACGTSAAAPHVAGEAALMRTQNPRINSDYVMHLVQTQVDPYEHTSGRHIAAGGGRINVFGALKAAGKPTLSVIVAPATYEVASFPIPTAVVHLDHAAGLSGATVNLLSLESEISVPPSVYVPAGSTSSPPFAVSVHDAPSWSRATLVASYAGGVATGSVWIYANVQQTLDSMKAILVDQNVVRQGKDIIMHVVFGQLPRTDMTFTITSSRPGIVHLPATVSLGHDLQVRTLYLRAGAVARAVNVRLTARAGKIVRTATVRVVP